jgi:dihydropteroate synthase
MQIGSRQFDFGLKTYVMGVLNLTPDSFSDGGLFNEPTRALDRALKMQAEGADIIDIGGESTRPGARAISLEEENRRILPILRIIAPRLEIPISVDTRRAAVADAALKEGASMINDVSALRYDFRMGEVVAQAGVPLILMHMQGDPETMQEGIRYLNVVAEIIHFLKAQTQVAIRFGIDRSRILIDPGIGFGKEGFHNLEILRHLNDFKVLENPLVVGASRKSFIRRIVESEDPRNGAVTNGSLAVAALAAWNGASLLRVHDVKETVAVLKVVQALKESGTVKV